MKWRTISRATQILSRSFGILNILKIPKIVDIFLSFSKISPSKSKFLTTKIVQHARWQWMVNMCKSFKSISSKTAELWYKSCQKRALFTSTAIFLIVFFTDLDASKSVLVIDALFAKLWLKMLKTSIAALNHEIFCLTFFTWLAEMTLTYVGIMYIMVTKNMTWCLKMSETLSMPIRWLCLSLTSQFFTPMSPSPKSRNFLLWPDLWCHSLPRGH